MIDDKDIGKLSEVFATKDDLEKFSTKEELVEFKSEILDGQDQILKELKTLTQEKTIKDKQDKRQKEVLKIHNGALKRNKILSDEESSKISHAGVF